MVLGMNSYWQNVRKECGKWSWFGYTGIPSSATCATAIGILQLNSYYLFPDPFNPGRFRKQYVTYESTNSIQQGLWNNPALQN